MNDIVNVQGVRGYIAEDGTAWLNVEDVARGLGFTENAASGNVTIRWRTVRTYLESFGYKPVAGSCDDVKTGDYIPENMFYRLAMKARNETAERFQAIVADDILPTIRKTGSYSVTGNVAHAKIRVFNTAINDIGDTAERLREVFGVAQGMALAKATAIVETVYQMDLSEVKSLIAPVQDAGTLTPSAIAKMVGMKSGQAVNKAFCELELQEKTEDGYILTDEGKKYAEQIPYTAPNGHCGYQIKWQPSVVSFLQ